MTRTHDAARFVILSGGEAGARDPTTACPALAADKIHTNRIRREFRLYGNATVSPDAMLLHCVVGTPDRFTLPVTFDPASQKISTAFPPISVSAFPALT